MATTVDRTNRERYEIERISGWFRLTPGLIGIASGILVYLADAPEPAPENLWLLIALLGLISLFAALWPSELEQHWEEAFAAKKEADKERGATAPELDTFALVVAGRLDVVQALNLDAALRDGRVAYINNFLYRTDHLYTDSFIQHRLYQACSYLCDVITLIFGPLIALAVVGAALVALFAVSPLLIPLIVIAVVLVMIYLKMN